MARILYDFLTESLLFSDQHISTNYSGVSEDTLNRELERYRDHSLSNAKPLLEEIREANNKLTVTMEGFNSFLPDENTLKQCALYMDTVTINDPLFEMTKPKNISTKVVSHFVSLPNESGLERDKLAKSVAYMKNLSQAVGADFIKFFPMSYLHETPKELPILKSENYFEDVLPPELLKWFHEKTKVVSTKKTGEGIRILDSLEIGRGIYIEFEGHTSGKGFMYKLFQMEMESFDEATRKAVMKYTLPKEPPEADYFNAWVYQSKNKAARAFYDQVISELHYTSLMGNSYFTRSPFIADLMDYLFGKTQNIRENAYHLGLKLDLPTIDNVSLEKIMSIRVSDGEAFYNFRVELEKQMRDLRNITDPIQLQIKLQNISHELETVQINEINKKLSHLKKSLLAESLIYLSSLYASTQFGLKGLLGSLVGIGWGALRSYNDKWVPVKDNPAYFLWRVRP